MHGFDPNSDEEIGLAARDPGRPPRLDFRP
jgi:hypothetical protein